MVCLGNGQHFFPLCPLHLSLHSSSSQNTCTHPLGGTQALVPMPVLRVFSPTICELFEVKNYVLFMTIYPTPRIVISTEK